MNLPFSSNTAWKDKGGNAVAWSVQKRLQCHLFLLEFHVLCYFRNMLKTKTTSTATNENGRLPKASDFKLPKKLDALTKRRIATSEAVLEGFRKAREHGKNSKG